MVQQSAPSKSSPGSEWEEIARRLVPRLSLLSNATLPMKPWAGVMVIVDVFPLVAPAVTVTLVPATERNGLLELTT
jgi:hypothetical protein